MNPPHSHHKGLTMTRADRLLVTTLRRSVSIRLLAGDDPARIKTETLARVTRSFGRAYAAPDLADLLPGKLELARRTLDALLSVETAGMN